MEYTADELLAYIKENGMVQCVRTEDYDDIPKDDPLWYGDNGKNISTCDGQTDSKNKGLSYNYMYIGYWHVDYTGKFIIVGSTESKPTKKKHTYTTIKKRDD